MIPISCPLCLSTLEGPFHKAGQKVICPTCQQPFVIPDLFLAPRMIQSMEILQLPIMALQERIQQELQENPVLELRESADEVPSVDEDANGFAEAQTKERDPTDPQQELVIDDKGDNEQDFDLLEALSKDMEDHFADNIPYVIPDIVVDRTEAGDYTVRLLDDWTPNISMSKRYIELYRDKAADPKAKEYLKRKIQAAQWLLESIEQRRNTLEKVTRAIIQHQRAFLDKGPEYLEPLQVQRIADLAGVHGTTVTRAVENKWMQTPHGLFPLQRFFV